MLRLSQDIRDNDQDKTVQGEEWATKNRGTHGGASANGQGSSKEQRAHAKQQNS